MTPIQAVRSRWNQAGAERWAATALVALFAAVLTVATVSSVRADPVRTLQIAAPFVFVFGVGIVGGLRKTAREAGGGTVTPPQERVAQTGEPAHLPPQR